MRYLLHSFYCNENLEPLYMFGNIKARAFKILSTRKPMIALKKVWICVVKKPVLSLVWYPGSGWLHLTGRAAARIPKTLKHMHARLK